MIQRGHRYHKLQERPLLSLSIRSLSSPLHESNLSDGNVIARIQNSIKPPNEANTLRGPEVLECFVEKSRLVRALSVWPQANPAVRVARLHST